MRRDIIESWLAARGITLTDEQYAQLAAYQAAVLDANQRMNLTTITNPSDFAVKHMVDSLSLLPFLPATTAMGAVSLLDLGTGAGFPGVPLKIACPPLRLTLLDSLRKRVIFLQETLQAMGIEAQCIHARAEDMPRLSPHTLYDVITARAVAHLKKLCAYALPLLKPDGVFLAMKGPNVDAELYETAPMLEKYNAYVHETAPITPEAGMVHTVIVVKFK